MRNLTINCESAELKANTYKQVTIYLEDLDDSDLNNDDVYKVIELDNFIEYHGINVILDQITDEDIRFYLDARGE